MIKIIPYSNADEENYVYAICECMFVTEGIEIPRPEHTELIRVNCPRCNKELGIVALGKAEKRCYNYGICNR